MAELQSFPVWLTARGGSAHTSTARAAGYTKHRIAREVGRGSAARVRRSWLIAPDCDENRRKAASVGGRLTCVTAAAAVGLWTPDADDVHVSVLHSASRLDSKGLRLHRAVGPAPVAATTPVDPIVNILFHVARCLVPAEALAVWESAIRHRLADADTLARVSWRSVRAVELAAVASSLSDSGIETPFTVIMREIGVRVRQQVWVDGHPLDGLIGDRLAVQIDGFAHHREARDRRRDIEADARLRLRGYTVLRFDWYQILFQPDQVRDTIRMAIAQGLHLAR